MLSLYRLEPFIQQQYGDRNKIPAFNPPPQNQSDRLIIYFRRVSDVKISEENSESLIGKSHIEFDFTYSLP